MVDEFLSTEVKCAALRFGNFRYEGGNCSMMDVAGFISGKLAKNVNEKYVTQLFLVVSAECLTATRTVTFLSRINRIWSKGDRFDGMEIVDYRLSWLVFD